MTLLADLARKKPKRRAPSLEPRLEPCSLCAGSGRFPDCYGCQGAGTVLVTPPWTPAQMKAAKSRAAKAAKRDAVRVVEAKDVEVPIRPGGVTDLAYAALLDLGWVDTAPPDDPRHTQMRLL